LAPVPVLLILVNLLLFFRSGCAGGTFLPQQWGNPSTRQFAQPMELVVKLAGIVLQGEI
jgi:hypothetical protein